MALRTVQQLKESVAGLLTGVNLDEVTNLDTALSRAARYVAQKIDAPEASGRESITLYGGVYYYNAPDILFGTTVNLIRPQGNVPANTLYSYKVPVDVFTRGKFFFPNGYLLDLEYNKGDGIIGVSSNVPLPQVILSTQGDSDDVTAGGTVSSLVTDTVNFYNPPASLRFNLSTGTGTITETIDAVDLSDYVGAGVAFLAIETDDVSVLSSIELRIGSSAAAYYSMTETEGFLGAWTADNWLLVAFQMSAATTVGVPDSSAIDYTEVLITTTGNIVNFRLGGLWMSQPSLNEILFQTAAIFKNSSGVLSQTITSDNDTIILNDAAFSILELECAKTIALQSAGGEYTAQIKGFDEILNGSGDEVGLYNHYRADNPSNALRVIDSYYDIGNSNGYRGY